MKQLTNDNIESYENEYRSLINKYSLAYLSGSSFYVGPSLIEWWWGDAASYQHKIIKWNHIRGIIKKNKQKKKNEI